jgi:hypothetical protein
MKYEFQDLFDELSGFIDYLNESTTFSERDSSLSFRENYFLERDYRDNPEYQNISIYSEDMTTMKKLEQVLTRLLSNNIKALDYNKVLSTQTTEYMKDDNSYTKDFQLDLKHNMTFTQVIKLIENEYIRDNFKGFENFKITISSSDKYYNRVTENSMPAFIYHMEYNKNSQLTKNGFIYLSLVSTGEWMFDLDRYESVLYTLLLIARNANEFRELGLRINFDRYRI